MKRTLFLLFLLSLLLPGCRLDGPPPVMTGVSFATLGDSLTMGTQDAGLSREMQLNCYPYRIAQQMGLSGFQQPYVDPAIGIPPYTAPFTYDGVNITFPGQVEPDLTYILTTVLPRLANAGLSRPYDNLGVNGARLVNGNGLGDLTDVTTFTDTAAGNFFFDIVLRNLFNSNFNNTTLLDQTALLEPEYVILWIGNNDVLSYLITGGNDVITEITKFQDELARVIARLRADTEAEIVMANVPVNPEFLAYACALDDAYVDGAFRLFDPETLEAIDFGGGVYVALETDEIPARLLLTAAAAYIQTGAGIPSDLDEAKKSVLADYLPELDFPDATVPIPAELTLTAAEVDNITTAVADFNTIIETAADAAGIPWLNVYDLFDSDTFESGGDYEGVATLDYVLKPGAQDKTLFSLDGVHPSNLGHAIIANEFIKLMNAELGLSIPEITDFAQFNDQYQSLDLRARSLDAVWGVRRLYGD